jgi:hypothetical protein
MDIIENFEYNVGKKCRKRCISNDSKKLYKIKPFKSTFKTNTIKGVINHPHLNIPAYIFHEDDSYVECRRVEIIN